MLMVPLLTLYVRPDDNHTWLGGVDVRSELMKHESAQREVYQALVAEVAGEQGLAVVVAIHDLNLALRFTHHLLFLKAGRVHALTSGRDLSAATIETVYGVPVHLSQVGGHTVVVPQ